MKKSWKTTLLSSAAAILGLLSSADSPLADTYKKPIQIAAWILVAGTGAAAQDHKEGGE